MYLCIYGEQNFGSHYFKVFFLHSSQHYKMGSSSYCNQITTLGTNWINLGTQCMQHFFLTSTPKILVWSMAINRGLSKNSKKTKNCLGSYAIRKNYKCGPISALNNIVLSKKITITGTSCTFSDETLHFGEFSQYSNNSILQIRCSVFSMYITGRSHNIPYCTVHISTVHNSEKLKQYVQCTLCRVNNKMTQ